MSGPYLLDEGHTPPALTLHGEIIFYFQRPPLGHPHYQVRETARLIVALLNKSYREGLSVADLKKLLAEDEQ